MTCDVTVDERRRRRNVAVSESFMIATTAVGRSVLRADWKGVGCEREAKRRDLKDIELIRDLFNNKVDTKTETER